MSYQQSAPRPLAVLEARNDQPVLRAGHADIEKTVIFVDGGVLRVLARCPDRGGIEPLRRRPDRNRPKPIGNWHLQERGLVRRNGAGVGEKHDRGLQALRAVHRHDADSHRGPAPCRGLPSGRRLDITRGRCPSEGVSRCSWSSASRRNSSTASPASGPSRDEQARRPAVGPEHGGVKPERARSRPPALRQRPAASLRRRRRGEPIAAGPARRTGSRSGPAQSP